MWKINGLSRSRALRSARPMERVGTPALTAHLLVASVIWSLWLPRVVLRIEGEPDATAVQVQLVWDLARLPLW